MNRTKKVLVVEDDLGVAKLQRRHLERSGYDVLLAATSQETLTLLGQHVIDLILLDFNLPGDLDGLSLFAQIKAAGYPQVPVILVTGFGNEAIVIQAMRAGVRDFVAKSMEYLEYLPEAIGRVLRQVDTERRLAESEARLGSIIGFAKDAIIVTEEDWRITLFNPAAETMFRLPAAQALGQPLTRFIPPNVLAKDQFFTPELRSESQGMRADGDKFPLETSLSHGEAGGRKFRTIIVRDVTEHKRLEEKFFMAQKMEAIGSLAGGVAHDFNNVLTVIIGFSEMAQTVVGPASQAADMLSEIRKAGERAAALTRQLLSFSRKQVIQPVLLDLNGLIRNLEKMLTRLIGEDVDLATVLADDLGPIRADPAQIEQVLMNLMVNSRDAMPQGGQITIETHNADIDEADRQNHPGATAGPHVILAVTDTGCGMDQSTLSHIFEPFFTTKEVGKGTGLGLATVYGIVKQSEGFIEVYSEPGQGTTFKIYLPRREADASRPSLLSIHGPLPHGTETILLAEDEDKVRETITLTLQGAGYTVIAAPSSTDALRIGQQRMGSIHLLITDIVMPVLSGRQLADTLAATQPNLKVLYLSGYTADAVIRHGVLETGIAFLQKPFTPSVLVRKVREVLDRAN